MSERDAPERVIGIDLGMTSVVAAWVPAPGLLPRVIPSERSAPALASVVAFEKDGRAVVGRAARDMLTIHPDRTITGIKRLLGRKAASQAVRDLASRVGFQLVAGPDGEARIRIGDRELQVPEVAGLLLDQTRRFAEVELGAPIRACVIAVPAYFNESQKAAVRESAHLAGMTVKKLVHEPTAVALAYGFNKGGDARVVIVDMGGIRLDVSVMEIAGNVFDVVATGGDPYLGGANVDARVAEWILQSIKKRHGRDLAREPQLLQKVWTAAEQAKRELSRCKAVDLQIPLAVGSKGQKVKVSLLRLHASTLDDLADSIVRRVIETIDRTLAERGLRPTEIDDVLLVGGGTRMPLLRRRIGAYFEREPRSSLPPEEVVALGAALLADSLGRDRASSNDVVETSIGIALADGRYMRIIDRESRLPVTRRVMIPTVRDRQRALEVDLFESDQEDILDATYLGTIVYGGIAEAEAGEAKVVVDLSLDVDRTLRVTSPEPGRDKEVYEWPVTGYRGGKGPQTSSPKLIVARGVPDAPTSKSDGQGERVPRWERDRGEKTRPLGDSRRGR